jgi:hypothetical protein
MRRAGQLRRHVPRSNGRFNAGSNALPRKSLLSGDRTGAFHPPIQESLP